MYYSSSAFFSSIPVFHLHRWRGEFTKDIIDLLQKIILQRLGEKQVCKVRLLAVFFLGKKLYATFAAFLFGKETNISKYTSIFVHTGLTVFSFKIFK
ncbi:hypothetical protein ABE34_01375 [Lysinibacillus sphaericus]|nr:hypothetical protein [Lysinibacillus sphaericus]